MLLLYNTLTRRKEEFKPILKKTVKLYTCGPTVYDAAHIGNLRTYIFEDILRRVLEYNGYRVRHVMNITDVEDKIIKRFRQEKRGSILDITEFYTRRFLNDICKLNIKHADAYPTVTGSIAAIIKVIRRLEQNGFAYRGRDGSVYFDISKFENYGRLARLGKVELKAGARVSADEYSKAEVADFVLWKTKRKGEPSWGSPFGEGRPGWHIECSAMSMEYLGETLDIHAGGVDLIFPHHENEIAQSEGATGKKFVNYWLHGEHLLVDGKKMAKSSRNFYTLDDIEQKGFHPLAYRYFVLGAHYRKKLNFTWEALSAAEKGLFNFYHDVALLAFLSGGDKMRSGVSRARRYEKEFQNAINDDLNIPKALAVARELAVDSRVSPRVRYAMLLNFDAVLGLDLKLARTVVQVPVEVQQLVRHRERLREHKQFVQADVLRLRVEELGYKIEDTSQGPFLWQKM